jgi:hypothetical protein
MKKATSYLVALLVGASLLAGCQHSTNTETWKLVGAYTWPMGEARTCTLDGKMHEGHCFTPSTITDMTNKDWPSFLVTVKFNKQPTYDAQQWAGLDNSITCRLDSTTRATCYVSK